MAAAAAGTAKADARGARQTAARTTSPADASAALAAATQSERGRRQPRAKHGAIAGSLWQEEEAAGPQDGTASVARPTSPPADAPKKRRAREILAAPPSPEILALAAQLPPHIHLGTSTWSFPGWNGIVYGDEYSNSKLSREGLTAYGAHPLLKTVSIDRSFYQALTVTEYLRYAQQVPEHFRFIVKAPMTITDATVRAERGEPVSLNPVLSERANGDRRFRHALSRRARRQSRCAGVPAFAAAGSDARATGGVHRTAGRVSDGACRSCRGAPATRSKSAMGVCLRHASSVRSKRRACGIAWGFTRACPIRCVRPRRSRCWMVNRRGR